MERGIALCKIKLQPHSKPPCWICGPCIPNPDTQTQNIVWSAVITSAVPSTGGKHSQSHGERSHEITSPTRGHLATNDCRHSRTHYARGWSQFLGCNEAAVMRVFIILI